MQACTKWVRACIQVRDRPRCSSGQIRLNQIPPRFADLKCIKVRLNVPFRTQNNSFYNALADVLRTLHFKAVPELSVVVNQCCFSSQFTFIRMLARITILTTVKPPVVLYNVFIFLIQEDIELICKAIVAYTLGFSYLA